MMGLAIVLMIGCDDGDDIDAAIQGHYPSL